MIIGRLKILSRLILAAITLAVPSSGWSSTGPLEDPASGPAARNDGRPASDPSGNPASNEDPHKKPWQAALKVTIGNIGLWAVDRYVFNYDFSRISWATIKRNFREGFIWDPDTFSTSFLGHSYSGGGYFNTARTLGMTFWESIPYSACGYLMWGFIFENDRPSTNDLIMTTLGGVNWGELQWRFSDQVLDDTATGGERVAREILAFLINPNRGIDRLVEGDMFRVRDVDRELHATLHGDITLSGMVISDSSSFQHTHFGPGLMFDMAYGLDAGSFTRGHPFDIIFLDGEVRYAGDQTRLQFSTYGPWVGHAWGAEGGQMHYFGLFQGYDFLDNEALHLGGTSTTLGLVSLFPLGHGARVMTSLQAGGLLLGGVKNDFVNTGQRHYNYGAGAVGKAEIEISHPVVGSLSLRLSHFRFFTLGGTAPTEADESRDVLTLLDARYALPITANWGCA